MPRKGADWMPVTVVCGTDGPAGAAAVSGLLLRVERLMSVYVESWQASTGQVVVRVGNSAGREEQIVPDLDHVCVSCTMRDVVAGAVRRAAESGFYDAAVVHLHPGIEPDVALGALVGQLGRVAYVDTVVTILTAGWYKALTQAVTVEEAGIAVWPGGDRAASTLLALGIEVADVLVRVVGDGPSALPSDQSAVLGLCAPGARQLAVLSPLDLEPAAVLCTGAFDASRLDPFADYGLRDDAVQLPAGDHGLARLRWTSQRPLHPGRFWDRLDDLAGGVVRSSGRLWFATRPELVLSWDTAGDGLRFGPTTRWLTPAPDCAGLGSDALPTAAHRAHALARTHPYYGDRENMLVFLGNGPRLTQVREVLDGCLLTDDELSEGAATWRGLPDPFPAWELPRAGGFAAGAA